MPAIEQSLSKDDSGHTGNTGVADNDGFCGKAEVGGDVMSRLAGENL